MNVQSISHGTMQCEVKSGSHGPGLSRSWSCRGVLSFVAKLKTWPVRWRNVREVREREREGRGNVVIEVSNSDSSTE